MKKLIVILLMLMSSNAYALIGSFKSARTMTVTVAASDAPQAFKDGADYLCDGTDDEIQINDALDDGAGRVVLSPGTFEMEESVLVLSDTILQGQGSLTIIKRVNTKDTQIVFLNNVDHVTLMDFCIDGNRASIGDNASDQGIALVVSRGSDNLIQRVEVKNSPSQGIALIGGDSLGDSGIQRTRVLDCYSHDNNLRGLYVQGIANDITFSRCIVVDNDLGGILFGMNASSNMLLSDCFFRNNGNKITGAIGATRPEIELNSIDFADAAPGSAGPCLNRRVVNNTIIRDDDISYYTELGPMMLSVEWGPGDVTITGNSFTNNVIGNTYGIDLHGPLSGIVFANNIFIMPNENAATYPMRIHMRGAPDDWVGSTAYKNMDLVKPTSPAGYWYYANIIDVDNRTTGGGEPSWPTIEGTSVVDGDVTWVCIEAKNHNIVINANSFETWAYSLVFRGGDTKQVTVSNNSFKSTRYGCIYFPAATNPCTGIVITGNIFRTFDTVSSVRHAIRDDDGATDYCIIKNNIWQHAGGLEDLDVLNNIVSDNLEQ